MRQLGRLEAVVMDRLWTSDGATTVREVLESLRPGRAIAYTTVMSVMDNLHRKGLLTREMDGRAYRYLPVQSRGEYDAERMGQILAGSTDRAATLLHFLDQIPPDEVARLRAALDQTSPSDHDSEKR